MQNLTKTVPFAMLLALAASGCSIIPGRDFSQVTPGTFDCISTSSPDEKLTIDINTKSGTVTFNNAHEARLASSSPQEVSEKAWSRLSPSTTFTHQAIIAHEEWEDSDREMPRQAISSFALDTKKGLLKRETEYYDGESNSAASTTSTTMKCAKR